MTQYVTLLGTEAVDRAGRNMQGAADQFERNVAWLNEGLEREHVRRQEALDRFEQLVGRFEKCVADVMNFLQNEDLTE